ncbi:SigE family RNA polymerase sigma factor [Intrasporangium sp. DVR]|uniref:SigE family RNA polymerase sigma factor n=1 Tax=Intrasporangium sp. DVR TaxID=3127867 RepID=UPI00313A5EB6
MLQEDEERFVDFVRAHSARLFRTAYLMTGDYQRAEDLLQTTLIRIYQRWTRVDAMERPAAYARTVLVSQSVSWWRRRSSRELPVGGGEELGWAGRIDEVPEHQRVWQAVLSLPPRQRAVMVLKYYEDLSEAEIAEVLNMAPGTVKSHAHRAARQLALLLGEAVVTPTQTVEGATS